MKVCALTSSLAKIGDLWIDVYERFPEAHNPEVAGSNPAPATKKLQVKGLITGIGDQALDRL
jgi:hypothetical protein